MNVRPIAAKITGSGSFLPGQPVENRQIAEARPDIPVSLFEKYFGITQRHVAIDLASREHRQIANEVGELVALNTNELAAQAALKALAEAGLEVNDIDAVIGNSTTPEKTLPTFAWSVQRRLGIKQAEIYDVRGGCSASMQALNTAVMLIETKRAKRILIVSSECTSPFYFKPLMNAEQPQFGEVMNGLLFADGASALVVESVETCQAEGKLGINIIYTGAKSCFADRRSGFVLHVRNGVAETAHDNTAIRRTLPLVLKAGMTELREVGFAFDTLDVIIIPQVNQTMVSLGFIDEFQGHKAKLCHYCSETGSVPAAAMFMALDHARRRASIAPNDRIGIVSLETISWNYAVAALQADEGLVS